MRTRQSGFSLLEAVVAMVILSMVVGALFAWQQVNFVALDRARAHAEHNRMIRSALAVMDDVNVMSEPHGERAVGTLQVSWQATPVEPRKTGQTASGHLSLFDLELYRVRVKVKQGRQSMATFALRKVGFEQARQPSTD